MQDINLLPQSEIIEQTKVKAVKLSTILSAVFLLLVIVGSGYIFYLNNRTKQQISALDSDIQGLRDQITARSSIEITVRNLDKKYKALTNIFDGQKKYSLLLEELNSRKPGNVTFESIDLREGKANINGLANNYIEIASFVGNLSNTNFEGGKKGLESLFTSVTINSVSMEKNKNKIAFFIVVDFKQELLK